MLQQGADKKVQLAAYVDVPLQRVPERGAERAGSWLPLGGKKEGYMSSRKRSPLTPWWQHTRHTLSASRTLSWLYTMSDAQEAGRRNH